MMNGRIAVILFLGLNLQAATYSPELSKFETEARSEAQVLIKQILGPDTRFVVQVKATMREPSQKTYNPTEVGYLPFPGDVLKVSTKSTQELSIASLRINVLLPQNLNEQDVKTVESSLKDYFSVYNPQVKASLTSFKIEEKIEEKPTFEQYLEKYLKYIVAILGIIFATISLILLGSGVGRGLNALADGVKSLSQSTSNLKTKEEEPLKLEHSNEEASDDKEDSQSGTVSDSVVEKNLEAFKVLLKLDPVAFMQSFDVEKDASGMKWVLPLLDEPERKTIATLLGEGTLNQLKNSSEASIEKQPWLQDFLQRFVLNNLGSKGMLQRALSHAEISELMTLQKEEITQYLKEHRTPALWRIGGELLTVDEMESLIEGSDFEDWKQLLESATTTDNQLKEAFGEIKNVIGKSTDNQETAEGKPDQAYLDSKVFQSMKAALQKKDLSTGDEFLKKIHITSSAMAEKLGEEVWMPSKLELVPESYLKGIISTADVEEIFSIIYAFPDPWKSKIQSLVPDGNKRTILEDLIARSQQETKESNKKAAQQVAREFLDTLKTQHKSGVFQLLKKDNDPVLKAVA